VVKYTESYSSDEGVGTFTIHIKPLYGQEIEVLCEAPSATYNANSTVNFQIKLDNIFKLF